MLKAMKAGAAALLLAASPVAASACEAGAQDCPFPVEMKPGTDSVRPLVHTFTEGVECCYYSLAARAGQTLTWAFSGPAMRSVIIYPDGSADGPGIPESIPLEATGTYVLGFTPNLMADGAFGPFRATVTIR